MATIIDTLIQYCHEKGVGTETHPNGVLEIHTTPDDLQVFINISKAGPYTYTVEVWHSNAFTDRPFWTEVGTANWQWVHDECITLISEIIGDWETFHELTDAYHVPSLPHKRSKQEIVDFGTGV